MLASIRPVGVECGTHRCRGLWGCSRHVTSVCLRGGAVGGLPTVAIVVGVVLGVVIGAVVKAVGGQPRRGLWPRSAPPRFSLQPWGPG